MAPWRRGAVAVALGSAVACTSPARLPTISNPGEGIAIAVYARGDAGFGVVDDRRWLDITGEWITLDRIDEAAPLPSLVIEPLGASKLRIGACVRERIDTTPDGLQRLAHSRADAATGPVPKLPLGVLSPVVRCKVTGATGRQLVRVVHVAPAIRFRAEHEVDVVADAATIATRFALATPAWHVRAGLTLFDGLPGGTEGPREVAHGTIELDGGVAVLALPPRVVTAQAQRIFDGAVRDKDTPDSDLSWGHESKTDVWYVLALAEPTALPGGVAHVRVDQREVAVAATEREVVAGQLRLPLWIDPALKGVRKQRLDRLDKGFAQTFELAVSNVGDDAREVWIEERLRAMRYRSIDSAAPRLDGDPAAPRLAQPPPPVIAGNLARVRTTAQPGSTVRTSFVVVYQP